MRSQERLRIEVPGYHTQGTWIVNPAPISPLRRERCTRVQHNDEDDEDENEDHSLCLEVPLKTPIDSAVVSYALLCLFPRG